MTDTVRTSLRASDAQSPKREFAQQGARLLHIRAGRSQAEMAGLFGVSDRTYSYWEHGEREMAASAVVALMAEGWNANWVLTGSGPERLPAKWDGGLRVEEDEPGYLSQPGRPIQPTLVAALEVVESGLEALDQDMTATGKAALVGLVYERLARSEAPTPAQLVGFVLNAIRESVNAGGSTGG